MLKYGLVVVKGKLQYKRMVRGGCRLGVQMRMGGEEVMEFGCKRRNEGEERDDSDGLWFFRCGVRIKRSRVHMEQVAR